MYLCSCTNLAAQRALITAFSRIVVGVCYFSECVLLVLWCAGNACKWYGSPRYCRYCTNHAEAKVGRYNSVFFSSCICLSSCLTTSSCWNVFYCKDGHFKVNILRMSFFLPIRLYFFLFHLWRCNICMDSSWMSIVFWNSPEWWVVEEGSQCALWESRACLMSVVCLFVCLFVAVLRSHGGLLRCSGTGCTWCSNVLLPYTTIDTHHVWVLLALYLVLSYTLLWSL